MMKKIWKLFAALSMLMVFATTSCAIYIGGSYPEKYYNLEWITISDIDYNKTYKDKDYDTMMIAKEWWTTSAYENVYEKKIRINEDQVCTFLKKHSITDEEDITRTFKEANAGAVFIFYNLSSNKKGVLYIKQVD